MAHKKTTSRRAARKTSRALRSKRGTKTTKSRAGTATSQNPGKTPSTAGRRISARPKDIASPKSASQIRKDVGVTKHDRATARRAARRYD